jgi:hypothetical protein
MITSILFVFAQVSSGIFISTHLQGDPMPRNPRTPQPSRNNYRSKSIRILKSATYGITRATANAGSKGIEKTFKWLATDHHGTTDFNLRQSSIMEAQHNINSSVASFNLSLRRSRRFRERLERRLNGIEVDLLTDWLGVATGWIIDHLLYLLDILWGFIQPILEFIFWSIVRVVLIIVCYIAFFGAIFLILSA